GLAELILAELILAHNLLWGLVLAQALVGGLAQAAAARPLPELDLSHQPRLAEDGPGRRLGAGGKRRALAPQACEQAAEPIELLLAEAGAHAPGVAQPAAALIHAHEQRADAVAAAPLAGHPATDHELLAPEVLDLQPARAAAPRLVAGV